MTEWQPIETAPRTEDQEILVCNYSTVDRPDGGQVTFYYCDVVKWVSWADDDRGGWFNGDVSQPADGYDYWQPVPTPPKAA